MTQTQHATRVTEYLGEMLGDGVLFPETFAADAAACFLLRLAPEEAARKLYAEYTGDALPDQGAYPPGDDIPF